MALFGFFSSLGKNNSTYTSESCEDKVYKLESQLEKYKSALEEVNNNIEDAKSSAWGSYDEMGEALDNLETVSEP